MNGTKKDTIKQVTIVLVIEVTFSSSSSSGNYGGTVIFSILKPSSSLKISFLDMKKSVAKKAIEIWSLGFSEDTDKGFVKFSFISICHEENESIENDSRAGTFFELEKISISSSSTSMAVKYSISIKVSIFWFMVSKLVVSLK